MYRLVITSVFVFLLLSRPCLAGNVIAQVMPGKNKTMEVVFFDGDQEVARWHYDKDGQIVKKTGSVPDGNVDTYSNGILMSRARFKDGQLNGTSRDYYTNGNLRTVARYKDGQLNGKLTVYYDGGGRHFITHYRDGVPTEVIQVYWMNGKLKTRGHFEEGKIKLIERFDQKGKLVKKQVIPEGKALGPMETP